MHNKNLYINFAIQSTFNLKNMENHQDHLKNLTEIRSLMEKSSRFISLSGLSGIFAGIFALAGAAAIFIRFDYHFIQRYIEGGVYSYSRMLHKSDLLDFIVFAFIDAVVVLTLAVGSAVFFTIRKSKKKGQSIWDKAGLRMLVNLAIPLATGGIFCLILIWHGIIYLVGPATLIFYGLSLLNAGKYTLNDVRYLGICEIVLGLVATVFTGYSLFFWAVGFGVLHIVYGAVMYFKYETR